MRVRIYKARDGRRPQAYLNDMSRTAIERNAVDAHRQLAAFQEIVDGTGPELSGTSYMLQNYQRRALVACLWHMKTEQAGNGLGNLFLNFKDVL